MAELWRMASGAWDHTAVLALRIAEAGFGFDGQPLSIDDFHPFKRGLVTARRESVMPYDPKVMESLQTSGKLLR